MGTKFIAKRAGEISPFIVMEILERAQALEAAGHGIVHLEIGEPDFNTPAAVKGAAHHTIETDQTKYTHSLGLLALRQAIANHYANRYGVSVDPERVIITTGSSGGMLLSFFSLIDRGDEVILSDPGYPCYSNFVTLAEGKVRYLKLVENEGWQVVPGRLDSLIQGRTKAVVVTSPANPTGIVLSAKSLAGVAEIARDRALVISDEIYHGMVYEGHEHSILEFTDQAIVINGFSKLYAMTGWRLGWLIVPPELVRPIQKLQQNLFISAPTISQSAAVAAFESTAQSEIEEMIHVYDERRRWLVPRLRELGFGVAVEPTGAFYVFANAKHLNADSHSLAIEILEQAKVALTPGIDFGPGGEGYLRFSYANSLDQIKEGCCRLEGWLKTRA